MKIFLTGGTGFIGQYVAHRLAKGGHTMRCLVRKTSRTETLKQLGAELVPGDVADKPSILNGMRGCDWVLNLANVYSFWEPDKRIYSRVNIAGTRNVLECALETGVSKVVHVSTIGIYGKPSTTPITEDSPVGPVQFSEYFRTKYEGDLIAWELYKSRALPLVMVYPVAVVGPGDTKATGQYIERLVRRHMPARVLEDSLFTFVHVRDVAEAIVRAAEKKDNLGEKYIVGNARLTFGEINRMVSEIAGVPLPKLRLPDIMVTINARLLTWLADMTKRPPIWDLSVDMVRVMKEGFIADGGKAERELSLVYTPIRTAIEEVISTHRL
jgi:dihydroflavonol-4-reductase